ncbi:MAG TPA: ribbon-helix-helix protein, CopG family [Tepidisphaeraceae bacterium]|nr:ribbon-helix-helix protein, CopG family [Tepidisphaeraceae bacterium]
MIHASPIEKFLALSDAEKERVWESFNREIPYEETRPLTPEQRKQWQRIRRKLGRAKSKGVVDAARVQITVERKLLEKADNRAKAMGMSRSQLITRGIERMLS